MAMSSSLKSRSMAKGDSVASEGKGSHGLLCKAKTHRWLV